MIPTILELAHEGAGAGDALSDHPGRPARPGGAADRVLPSGFGQEPAMDCFIGGVIAINAGPNLVGLIYRKK